MRTIAIETATDQLLQLAHEAKGGEEIILTESDLPIARLVPLEAPLLPRRPGSAKGIILHIADDFDETPEGFEEYQP